MIQKKLKKDKNQAASCNSIKESAFLCPRTRYIETVSWPGLVPRSRGARFPGNPVTSRPFHALPAARDWQVPGNERGRFATEPRGPPEATTTRTAAAAAHAYKPETATVGKKRVGGRARLWRQTDWPRQVKWRLRLAGGCLGEWRRCATSGRGWFVRSGQVRRAGASFVFSFEE